MSEVVSKELTSEVSAEIQAAIAPILAKHGLTLTKFTSKYGDSYGVSISASPVILDESGVNTASNEAIYYTRFGYTAWLGKSLDDRVELTAKLGTKFQSGGNEYKFVGVRTRGKNKIVAERGGKSFVFADTIVPFINKASK
jgi:hypothetical protein